MAERFYNHRGRTLVVLVILLDLAIVQRIDGYPSNRSTLPGHRKFYSRSVEDEEKNGPVPSCKKTTFCVETPFYPSDYVASVLSMNKDLKKLATVDVPTVASQRIDLTDDGEALCSSREQMVRPRTALSINKQWLYVVNSPELVQILRVEICESENSSCNIINEFADGYKTTCKQAYVYRKLIAIDGNGAMVQEFFKIPATCKCYVKFTGDRLTRMGVSLGKAKQQQSSFSKKKSN